MNPYPRKGDRPPWSWQGVSALVIAVSIGGGWLVGIVLAALESAGSAEVDRELASLLNGIGQVLAGALGTYLGFTAGAVNQSHAPAVTPTPRAPSE